MYLHLEKKKEAGIESEQAAERRMNPEVVKRQQQRCYSVLEACDTLSRSLSFSLYVFMCHRITVGKTE